MPLDRRRYREQLRAERARLYSLAATQKDYPIDSRVQALADILIGSVVAVKAGTRGKVVEPDGICKEEGRVCVEWDQRIDGDTCCIRVFPAEIEQADLSIVVRNLAGNILVDTWVDRTWTGLQLTKHIISVAPPANGVHYSFLYGENVLHPEIALRELLSAEDVDRIEVTACAQDNVTGKYLSSVLTEDIVYYLCVDLIVIELHADTTVTCACLSRCRRWLHGTWVCLGGKVIATFTRMDVEIAPETRDISLTLELTVESNGSLKLVNYSSEGLFSYSHWMQPGFTFTYEAESDTEKIFVVNTRDVELVESQIDYCNWPRQWVIRVLHTLQNDIVEAIMLISDYEHGLLERNLERARDCAVT